MKIDIAVKNSFWLRRYQRYTGVWPGLIFLQFQVYLAESLPSFGRQVFSFWGKAMSIACRVHIMPSRSFKFMLGSMLLGSVAVGLWLATQTWLPLLWRCAMSFGIALACFFAVWQAKPFLRPWDATGYGAG